MTHWVVARWYAPALGRFVSEDSLIGNPTDPPTRHLYAYGQGEPVARWDPDGRFWYRWRSGDTAADNAAVYLGSSTRARAIINTNRNRALVAGACVWIPRNVWYPTSGRGAEFAAEYGVRWAFGTGPSNALEAPAYLWEGWINYYFRYWEKPPWEVFRPI